MHEILRNEVPLKVQLEPGLPHYLKLKLCEFKPPVTINFTYDQWFLDSTIPRDLKIFGSFTNLEPGTNKNDRSYMRPSKISVEETIQNKQSFKNKYFYISLLTNIKTTLFVNAFSL